MSTPEALRLYCKTLRLPTMLHALTDTVQRAEQESWTYEQLRIPVKTITVSGPRRSVRPVDDDQAFWPWRSPKA